MRTTTRRAAPRRAARFGERLQIGEHADGRPSAGSATSPSRRRSRVTSCIQPPGDRQQIANDRRQIEAVACRPHSHERFGCDVFGRRTVAREGQREAIHAAGILPIERVEVRHVLEGIARPAGLVTVRCGGRVRRPVQLEESSLALSFTAAFLAASSGAPRTPVRPGVTASTPRPKSGGSSPAMDAHRRPRCRREIAGCRVRRRSRESPTESAASTA